jgi:hypothetical protein
MEFLDQRRTLDVLLRSGSGADVHAFLGSLDASTRAELFASRETLCWDGNEGKQSHWRFCVDNILLDHASALLQFGAPLEEPDSQSPFAVAIIMAATCRFLPILEVAVAAARSNKTLAAVMRVASPVAILPTCLQRVCTHDFAPALALLLDAGLDPAAGVAYDGYAEDSAAGQRWHATPCSTLIGYAASTGALTCLRLLHERCSHAEWKQLLSPRPRKLCASPLARAFDAGQAGAVEYLLTFHSPGGVDGPDLLPAEAIDRALVILAENAPDPTRPLQVRLAAARTAYASWDARTRAETVLALLLATHVRQEPARYATGVGSHRAAGALAGAGLVGDIISAPTTETAAVLLDAVAAADAARDPTGAADVTFVRRRLAARLLRSQAASFHHDTDSVEAMCVLLAAAAPDVSAETMASLLRRSTLLPDAVKAVRLARATTEIGVTAEACAAALNAVVASTEWWLLSRSVTRGHVMFAQIFADKGADVFATSRGWSLLCLAMHAPADRPSPMLASAPPPGADPAVAATMARGVFASSEGAHAHAIAAAAEEERLLTAALENPRSIIAGSQDKPAWNWWARSLRSALGVRWAWQRMFERDPERANAYLQPSAHGLSLKAPLSEVIATRNVRCVRFLASVGARMTAADAPHLALVCINGYEELAWALLAALPNDAAERASVLEAAVTHVGAYTAIGAVAMAVRRGLRFSQPLIEALRAAGATVPHTLLHSLCDKSAPIALPRHGHNTPLPGELARAVRWTLEHFQRILQPADSNFPMTLT